MGKEIKLNDNQVWTGVVGGVIAGMILIISDSFGEMFSGGIKIIIKLGLAIVITMVLMVLYLKPKNKN